MMIANKEELIQWKCEPVIQQLMMEYRWSYAQSHQWFTDFMRWLYSSRKWATRDDNESKVFHMDGLHYLDDVWHVYILHSVEYFKMCKTLFNLEYIHHYPSNKIDPPKLDGAVFKNQMIFLLDEWGEEYIDRVWAHGADLSDLATQNNIIIV